MARAPREQLSLFETEQAPKAGVLPAPAAQELRSLGETLPSALHLGTSSWSFPGWEGIVYDGKFGEQRLAREGLGAYARHPLFRSVGIDRTYYGPVTAEVFARYAQSVPDGFQFLTKAHEYCTQARFPDHPRYGARRGSDNPFFFDPSYATQEVVGPWMEGLGAKAGPLVFQFAPQAELTGMGEAEFAERLEGFLSSLPKGPLYAVELRNRPLLTPRYAQALASAQAVHCFNAWSDMPALAAQSAVVGEQRALVVRWLLPPQTAYAAAKERYAPFNRLMDPDESTREAIVDLVLATKGRPGYVIINNKAEGSSPLSVVALARRLAERGAP